MSVANLREPIAESWRRASLAGLEPSSAISSLTYVDVDGGGPLVTAASPVLAELSERLDGTAFGTMLVDREGRMLQRWAGDAGARRAFDNLGLDVGASLLEDSIGTNAPGTALETRRGISVSGHEHFAEKLRRFSCYGHPIFHPTTRRIEGVLDLTTMAEKASPLLPPLVMRAVADIEQRLLDRSRSSDKELLAAFQVAAARRRPVIAIGHDLFMANHSALDHLGSSDVALLSMLARNTTDNERLEIALESGAQVRVRLERVGGPRCGALVHVDPRPIKRAPRAPSSVSTTAAVLVCGPPGSGRTSRARELADTTKPVTVLTAASALLDGAQEWAREFSALLRSGQGAVCVDGIDLLPESLIDLVASHVASGRSPQLFLICGDAEDLTGSAAALAAQCIERKVLTPLVSRLHELPDLISAMLRGLGAEPSLHMTPGALRALSAQPWPGNLRELRTVVEHVARARTGGGIVIDDLPEAYRSSEPVRQMAPIRRAERDAITVALRLHDGNKKRVAESLGISRTTLYSKMRALRITVY